MIDTHPTALGLLLILTLTQCQPEPAPGEGTTVHPISSDQELAEKFQNIRCDTEPFRDFADRVVVTSRRADSRALDPDEFIVAAGELNNSQVHDCQRLIKPGGPQAAAPLVYGPLVAIFVSPERVSQTVPSDGHVVAEIVNYDSAAYDPLGIEPGVSCLWIAPHPDGTGLTAAIHGPVDDNCVRADFDADPASMMDVAILQVEQGAPEYPSTGRWMWDADGRLQFIGIRCGDAWCEIGPEGFVGTDRIATAEDVPGRFDRQLLAYQAAPGDSLMVSELTGLIAPGQDNVLAEYPTRENNPNPRGSRGLHVATMSFTGADTAAWAAYAGKFALDPQEFRADHPVFMHPDDNGLPSDVNPLRRFQNGHMSPDQWVSVRRCNVSHSGSGTVRWAWNETDEGFWVPCDAGCCVVQTF